MGFLEFSIGVKQIT